MSRVAMNDMSLETLDLQGLQVKNMEESGEECFAIEFTRLTGAWKTDTPQKTQRM